MGKRSVWLLVLVGIVIGACEGGVEPLAVAPEAEQPSLSLFALLDCRVELTGERISCASKAAALPDDANALIVGSQGENVLLSSTNVSYDASSETFQADVTVKNLIGQALGTVDGETPHADGIRVFYITLPAAKGEASGTITVEDAETGLFSGSEQPYSPYDGLLAPGETSAARTWRWTVPSTVSEFEFSVAVWAEVQHPDGWVEFATGNEYLIHAAGDSTELEATAYDVLGAPLPLTWTSLDPQVATVSESGHIMGGEEIGATTLVASTEHGVVGSVQVSNGLIFVDASATGGNTGTSWADAFTDLQDALAVAGDPSEI